MTKRCKDCVHCVYWKGPRSKCFVYAKKISTPYTGGSYTVGVFTVEIIRAPEGLCKPEGLLFVAKPAPTTFAVRLSHRRNK